MSGFAPTLRSFARHATSALLLASSSAAFAQSAAAPVMIGVPAALGTQAYGNADRVASTLLAGGMSRLAAISAQQGGGISLPWSSAAAPQEIINERRIGDFQGKLPGWQLQGVRLTLDRGATGYRQPDLMPAFMRGLTVPALLPQPARPVDMPTLRPTTAPRIGQPDVFGSVAMAVSHTALDGKWASISPAITGKGVWSGILQAARAAGPAQQVEMINSWVNQRLRFVDDRAGSDNWAAAAQSLTRGAGDCEDYAIAKMKLLEAAGFDRHAMFLVIARDLVRQADHAVLAVRIGEELMILDDMTDQVLPSSSVSDYRPILSFNAFGRWTHGYRVKTPQPVQFAAR
ncbi:transglutaminase-like cysteine peptidase [Sphingobium mellinum]|uniref:transglutaminase-like cysteine peptidase n=1 Tax=Sphingobium mellinum TaxID=1387166 RepID=UPI0030ED2302